VFVIGVDGTNERRLTEPRMVAGEPDWSPDGEWIVFSTYPLNVFQSGGDSQLYRMRPNGTGLEQLTRLEDVRATQPRYSPDGAWIVFTSVTGSQRSLWAVPAEGGEPVVLADQGSIHTHGVWQPEPVQ
jgi:TolB protein